VNKSELIEELSTYTNLNLKDAEIIVDLFFNSIIDGLKQDERAELRGFGSFSVKHYPAYIGRNPKSGKAIEVKPKRMPVFKPGKDLKIIVNPDLKESELDFNDE
jgi:integration host factor subunit beta